MYRIRRKRKHWKKAWLWRKLFPPKVNERFCPTCSLPFQDGAMPNPAGTFGVGNLGAIIYPAGGFRGGQRVVRFGRWRPGHGKFYCSEYIPEQELDQLLSLIQLTKDELTLLRNSRAANQ